jgi:hypothetical protein
MHHNFRENPDDFAQFPHGNRKVSKDPLTTIMEILKAIMELTKSLMTFPKVSMTLADSLMVLVKSFMTFHKSMRFLENNIREFQKSFRDLRHFRTLHARTILTSAYRRASPRKCSKNAKSTAFDSSFGSCFARLVMATRFV